MQRPSGSDPNGKGRSVALDRPLGVFSRLWRGLPLVAHAEGDGGFLVSALPADAAVEEGGEVVADGEQVGFALHLAEDAIDLVEVGEVRSAGDHQGGVGLAVPLVPDAAFEGELDLVVLVGRGGADRGAE